MNFRPRAGAVRVRSGLGPIAVTVASLRGPGFPQRALPVASSEPFFPCRPRTAAERWASDWRIVQGFVDGPHGGR